MEAAGRKAGETYNAAMVGVEGIWKSWQECRDMFPTKLDEAQDFYFAQTQISAIKANLGHGDLFFEKDELLVGRERYVQTARASAVAPFAFVQDRNWHERGEMGWWGVVIDEKDRNSWAEQFMKAFDALPDDTVLTVVDCHI